MTQAEIEKELKTQMFEMVQDLHEKHGVMIEAILFEWDHFQSQSESRDVVATCEIRSVYRNG